MIGHLTALAKAAAVYTVLAAMTICPDQAPAKVDLQFTNKPPVEHNDKSGAELGNYHVSTTFSHSQNEIFTVGGLMLSKFEPHYKTRFGVVTDAEGLTECLSLYDVAITVDYAPEIYIASEAKTGSCRYTVTLQHEVRHVNTDIITFNEYLPQLKKAVEDAAATMKPLGPFDISRHKEMEDVIFKAVEDSLAKKAGEIEQTRMNRQQMIDTRAEYLRGSKLCGGE